MSSKLETVIHCASFFSGEEQAKAARNIIAINSF
jgi:hypothetical protein